MASITEIKAKICQLSPAQFQEFCDDFLYRKGYKNIHSYGMQPGTGNTTIGNPDTYFKNDNGKYVFVAYTKQQTGLYNKILEDIEKCLDPSKTGLPITEIDEIICCHASSNLSAGDDNKLHERCNDVGVKFTIYGVDEIAEQTQLDFPSLAKQYLHLELDTNQLVTFQEFVKRYDANALAAPLDTEFLFREEEKEKIIAGLISYDVVIINGKSGVGKTRLALEAARDYANKEKYHLVCVKNYNMSLYDDLHSLTEQAGNYILLIDDANELINLREVLSFINNDESRYHVKLLLTVRDYAFADVLRAVKSIIDPLLVSIERFNDEEISEFVNKSLGIKNERYIQQIVRIAEGNPRIAFMAGKLAIEHNKLSAIYDVSELLDEYYSTYVDQEIGKDRDLCLTAGILSVVNAVVLSNLDGLDELINKVSITRDSFIDKIHQLSEYEVVEIVKGQVATISDQCLANYMIYYVFFKKRLIPFSLILEIGYRHFHDGVIKSVNTILNIYNNEETRDYCKKEVIKVWNSFSQNKDSCYYKFVNDFHTFNPEEAFLIFEDSINRITQEDYDPFHVEDDRSSFDLNTNLLVLLEGYRNSDYIKCVVELLVAYCSKSERSMVSGCKWLKENYGIDRDSIIRGFVTQQQVSNELLSLVTANNVYASYIAFEWIKYSLNFEFDVVEQSRGHKLLLSRPILQETEYLRHYRDTCFDCLAIIVKERDDLRLETLSTYVKAIYDEIDPRVVSGDMTKIEGLITGYKCDNVQYLTAIEGIITYCERHSIQYNLSWNECFDNEKWSLYKVLRDDYHMFELDYDDYRKFRIERIKNYAKTQNGDTIKVLTDNVNSILSELSADRNVYCVNEGLEIVLHELSSECLLVFLDEFFVNGGSIDISPGVVLSLLLKSLTPKKALVLIKEHEFCQKNRWMFSFFEVLPQEKVDISMKEELLCFLKDDSDKDISKSPFRNLRFLDKYLDIEPEIYPIACRLIYEKNYNECIIRVYFELLFNEHNYKPNELFGLFSSDIELLQEIYIFMIMKGWLADYSGVFLNEFLLQSDNWIEKYAPVFWMKAYRYDNSEIYRCSYLWASDKYMQYYNYLFYNFPKDEMSEWKLEQAFINSIKRGHDLDSIRQHQAEWIQQMIVDNAFNDNINLLFKIVHSLDDDIRRDSINKFLELNDDIEVFKKLPLGPASFEGTDSLVPAYNKQVEFLKSLLPFVDGMKYLKHRALLNSRIDELKEVARNLEIDEFCQRLYE